MATTENDASVSNDIESRATTSGGHAGEKAITDTCSPADEAQTQENGLSSSYYYAFHQHDTGTGIACQPRKLTAEETQNQQQQLQQERAELSSDSKWNVNDYHWEER